MANPIPAHIRRLTQTHIKGKGDWVRRTRRARDLLIERHGYPVADFWELDGKDSPALGMSPLYPARWARRRWRRTRGRRRRFDWVARFPKGLILFNPGPDYWGEASDDQDPILLLGEIEHWASLTDEECRFLSMGDDA